MTDLIVKGDQAYTPEEYAAYRAKRERDNARNRERRRTDPEYRARRNAHVRKYRERHREEYNAYQREWMRRWREERKAA